MDRVLIAVYTLRQPGATAEITGVAVGLLRELPPQGGRGLVDAVPGAETCFVVRFEWSTGFEFLTVSFNATRSVSLSAE